MPRSPIYGRRIHIAGSVHTDPTVATPQDTAAAADLVRGLVLRLMGLGATFVVPVDAEKRHADERPVCFDWLVWEALQQGLTRRPAGAPNPLVVAVQHHKSEGQVPVARQPLWDDLRSSDLVTIENAAHWNMNSKRMETAAGLGDILIVLGGGEGVHFLANLYHAVGKPVVPLNLPLGPADQGALRLFNFGLTRSQSSRLFQVREGPDAHGWINRLNFAARRATAERIEDVIALLEALQPPRAFMVRLLNDQHADFADVETFFDTIVKPVVETEHGYRLTVVDGKQPFEHPRIDQEIFEKLHRSGIVIADITGVRPNCFIELGYALGRGHRTLMTARAGTETPFDTATLPGFFWNLTDLPEHGREAFRAHWTAAIDRPPLVTVEPLIP